MTPDELKKLLRIEIAVLKFDLTQFIDEKLKEIRADRDQHWRQEAARKREATW